MDAVLTDLLDAFDANADRLKEAILNDNFQVAFDIANEVCDFEAVMAEAAIVARSDEKIAILLYRLKTKFLPYKPAG